MIRFLKYILMYPVLLLLILHTFIPHAFSNSLPVTNHVKIHRDSQENLLGLFGLIFHEKHEKNLHNLNTLQVHENVGFSKSFPVVLYNFCMDDFDSPDLLIISIFENRHFHYSFLYVIQQNRWRGPPCRIFQLLSALKS